MTTTYTRRGSNILVGSDLDAVSTASIEAGFYTVAHILAAVSAYDNRLAVNVATAFRELARAAYRAITEEPAR